MSIIWDLNFPNWSVVCCTNTFHKLHSSNNVKKQQTCASTGLSWAMTQHVYLSVSYSLTLSVCFNTIWHCRLQAVYVSGHLFAVSDSPSRLYLTVHVLFCLSVWVMSFRCSVPGQTRCHHELFSLSALSSVTGHFLVQTLWGCIHTCMQKKLQC